MNAYRGKLLTRAAIRLFIEAGNATLTIQSKTGTRFTFKFRRPDDKNQTSNQRSWNAGAPPIWISVLNGPDNEANYAFIGSIFPSKSTTEIRPSGRSKVSLEAPSAQAVQWLLRQVYLGSNDEALFGRAEIWHEGVCGRCGRKLTVPESIDTGFGPECSSRMGIGRVRGVTRNDDDNFELPLSHGGPQ